MVYFAHLLILEDPHHHQNLTSSSLYHHRPLQQNLSQSVHNFLSNIAYKQMNRQKKKQTNDMSG